jgi:hypothetical protein
MTKMVSMTGSAGGKGVYVSGNYAYVVRTADTTTGANEFNVVNIATPASATVVGGYDNNIQMNEVYINGNYAYVATSSTTAEMLVINIATPTAPTLAATYNPPTTVAATTIDGYGSMVYLGMGTTLDAISIATPTSPTRLGTFAASGTINDVAVDSSNGNTVFLATTTVLLFSAMQVVAVSTPSAMTSPNTMATGIVSTMNGVAYNSSLDVVCGATTDATHEFVVAGKN